jgi:hypothetical protein
MQIDSPLLKTLFVILSLSQWLKQTQASMSRDA